MQRPTNKPKVAIACGGTGGHLFPGIAVAEELMIRGASVTLLVSPKEVDQQAVKGVRGAQVATLPAMTPRIATAMMAANSGMVKPTDGLAALNGSNDTVTM